MSELTDENLETLTRWRLILGKSAEKHQINMRGADQRSLQVGELVDYLFEENGGAEGGNGIRPALGERSGRGESSGLTIPEWVEHVRQLFPAQAKEVMEKQLVQSRGISQLLKHPELLEQVEPSLDLVKTLLTHRSLLNPDTRILARKIINTVVQQLKERMKLQVETAITGAMRRDRHSPRRVFRNLDIKKTLSRNLQHYDKKSGKLFVDRIYYFGASRKQRPWHVMVIVDQSGSMLDSAVFSAIMASVFAELPALRTSLILYDTRVVDISDKIGEPVDVLLSVNLGGGNDTALALRYAQQLVREPSRTIAILISDFFEGGGAPERDMIANVRSMFDSGIRMIGLGALGYDARPSYCKATAAKLRKAGMDILVCTPEKLAECMAKSSEGKKLTYNLKLRCSTSKIGVLSVSDSDCWEQE